MYNNHYQGSLIDNREKIIAETIKCNLFSDILAKLTKGYWETWTNLLHSFQTLKRF